MRNKTFIFTGLSSLKREYQLLLNISSLDHMAVYWKHPLLACINYAHNIIVSQSWNEYMHSLQGEFKVKLSETYREI